jgi:hypothetical protein
VKLLSWDAQLSLICKGANTPGILVSFQPGIPDDELFSAAPWLKELWRTNISAFTEMQSSGCGIVLCETLDEANKLLHQTVGDDGPTAANPYNGPVRVYACVCDGNGRITSENT